LNEEYVQRVTRRVEDLAPLLAHRQLQVRRVGTGFLALRLDMRFHDGRRFEGNEIWAPSGRKYRFHMQREDGSILWRLDNAPHHSEVGTHPHHEHGPSGEVRAGADVSLEDLLGSAGRWTDRRRA